MWLGLTLAVHVAGLATAIAIVLQGHHRSRGAVAWVLALLGLPWITLPVYWLSGQVRYSDYSRSVSATRDRLTAAIPDLGQTLDRANRALPTTSAGNTPLRDSGEQRALGLLGVLPACRETSVNLYRESENAWSAIVRAIEKAESYVLIQTYLLRDDDLGMQLAKLLLDAVDRGCEVSLLFDELGSNEISGEYLQKLQDAGVAVTGFSQKRRLLSKLRMNFRNHRKIIVIDGTSGFLGGMNLGSEYLDGADQFRAWRDTHIAIEGPAVLALQMCFVEDWCFANKGEGSLKVSELNWRSASRQEDRAQRTKTEHEHRAVTICSLGPHRRVFTGDVLFTVLMEAAQTRLWIATPYFVPDDRVISTLKAAAMRGVDVRVIVPTVSDHPIFVSVHQEFGPRAETLWR